MKKTLSSLLIIFAGVLLFGKTAPDYINLYNLAWDSPSENSSESMPCGGGDIGLNVWVEGDDLLFYIARSGTFDENNEMLKLGRVRISFSPSPFSSSDFRQELHLEDGSVKIVAENNGIELAATIWVDVFNPSVYVDVESNKAVDAKVSYENWRYEDIELQKYESFGNSYKWASPEGLQKKKDSIWVDDNKVYFLHQNKGETVFDVTTEQQGLASVKDRMFNPLDSLVFGGVLYGKNLVFSNVSGGIYQQTAFKSWNFKSDKSAKNYQFGLCLNTDRTKDLNKWVANTLLNAEKAANEKSKAQKSSNEWWRNFWDRSFIIVDGDEIEQNTTSWQVGRNYQLFRYMLGCNAYGQYPTKFNGGLFTYDPCFVNDKRCFSPDFRNWGGGTFTAQNQRLVYLPMLKSGDEEMMKPQVDFYKNLLSNAELRTEFYWGHKGACFTEQLENFGLPNPSEYGWKRPEWYDKGRQYNAWLEYQWDASLEICLMVLDQYFYTGKDITEYLNLIYSCLEFFDEHYQYLARMRGRKELDGEGKLVLYPGSACETYKMAYNASSTVAGLKVVTEKLLSLPDSYIGNEKREQLEAFASRIPEISYREMDGKKMIAPAKMWERINNTEAPQMYPVYPWKLFGLEKDNLEIARNTYLYDTNLVAFRDYKSWKQSNIFAARLGLADTAWKYTELKLKDSGRKYPAFWGPGFDWVPDHNWGGSGMIGLQEMLLQEIDGKIYLFPAWPKDKDVHFKLHAPGNVVVEAKMEAGKATILNVFPQEAAGRVVVYGE